MFKSKSILAVTGAVIFIALVFIGYSLKETEYTNKNKKVPQEKVISISKGSQNMRNVLKDMKAKLNTKDEAGAIKISPKLEKNWSAVEDRVKIKSKDLYEKVETPLDTINAGVKVKPLDTKTITNAINSLDEILKKVEKLKQ